MGPAGIELATPGFAVRHASVADTKCPAWSGPKLFDTPKAFLKEFLEIVDFEKKSADDKKVWKNTQGAKC